MISFRTDSSGNVTLPSDLLPVPTNGGDWKDAYTGTYSSLVFEKAKRIAQLVLNFPALATERITAMFRSEVVTQTERSAKTYNCGPSLPQHNDSTVAAIDSPKLLPLFIPSSCISEEVIGEFCGSPIRNGIDYLAAEVLEQRDLQQRIEKNTESEEVYRARINNLLLPGQIVCSDGIIRREFALIHEEAA